MSDNQTYEGKKITLPRPLKFDEIPDFVAHLKEFSKERVITYSINGNQLGLDIDGKPRQSIKITSDKWNDGRSIGEIATYTGQSKDGREYHALSQSFFMSGVLGMRDSTWDLEGMLKKETDKVLAYFVRD